MQNLIKENILKHYIKSFYQCFYAFRWSQTWAFITTTSPGARYKNNAFHPGSRQGGNQQRTDVEIEVEQLTLTFWYGPTKKRWWTYLSTRLVFPTLSFPSITTLASTRIALIVTGFGEAQDETAAEQTGGGGGGGLMYKAAQCAVVKKQNKQQMSGNTNEVLNTICPSWETENYN